MADTFFLNNLFIEFPEKKYLITALREDKSCYEYFSIEALHKPYETYLFRWFRNMKSSCNAENYRKVIEEMIRVFTKVKDELFSALREMILMEGIAETCYEFNLQDGEIICQVLNLMYDCWSSFGPLHFKVILGKDKRKCPGNSTSFLEFYLEHARRKRLTYCGNRMVDVSIYSSFRKAPVFFAADTRRWKDVLVYLQYGAKLQDVLKDPNTSEYGQSSALIDNLRIMIRHLWFRLVSPSNALSFDDHSAVYSFCKNISSEVKCLYRTLNVLLRAVKNLSRGSLDFFIKERNLENAVTLVPSREVLMHPIVKILMSKLPKRYDCPVELKHACRLKIRDVLNENWELPVGIWRLPIPNELKCYVNLQLD